ncbi:MAG: sugar ABC transporter permease [Bdellovibrionales bacterium]|nr:sugar ABC transporter permease [Bdellovibrionales bacterium]
MKSAKAPYLVLAPSFAVVLVFVYGFVAWTGLMSFTRSTMIPRYHFVGFEQYVKLWANERWLTALTNLGIFATLFIVISLALGILLAILLDQKIRAEGLFRTLYLYPLALSLIVTGTAWKWILNPGIGLERLVHELGFTHFSFDWLVNPDKAIYTLVIAAVWQCAGFVMALFLAGLRAVDPNLIQAARIDGAGPWRIYLRIILPALRPVFFSAIVCLGHMAIKTFDLVLALTGGGPGFATDLPSTFMYTHAFLRGQIGFASASATLMLLTVLVLVVPYVYSELKGARQK